MRTQAIQLIHKPTGRTYWFDVKRAWDRTYYSADGGDTWHASKREAFTLAETSGTLLEAKETSHDAR